MRNLVHLVVIEKEADFLHFVTVFAPVLLPKSGARASFCLPRQSIPFVRVNLVNVVPQSIGGCLTWHHFRYL